ncbi:MAG: winged helix-turn-helix transcriptional regulator [Flavobacteriaceae bacterium]
MEIITDQKPKMKVRDNRSSCPVSTCLEIIGDNWSLVLIRDLFLERTTFTEFMNSPERISSNILTDRINKLTKYNLIEYRVHPNNRKIKQYYLTQAGIDLYPIIYDLIVWSIDHLDMKFDPTAVDWYQKNERLDRNQSTRNDIASYKDFKAQLLSL